MAWNKYRKPIISILLTLILLVIGAVIFQRFSAQKQSTLSTAAVPEEVRRVRTANFQPAQVSTDIPVDGRINAYEKINLSGEVTGRLIETGRSFRKGDYFEKGELLFRIYDEDERLNLYAERAVLLNTLSQMMPDLKFDYPQAFEKWRAYLDAFDVSKRTEELPEVTDRNEKYYLAGKNIYNQYYNIRRMEDDLQNYQVRAPFNGTFLELNAYPGSLVTPGATLATIMNTAKFELEAPIPSADLRYIRQGQRVLLRSEQFDREWTGTVSRISRQIDQNTQNVPVFISVYGSGLKDGMYLRGSLQGSSVEDVSKVPVDILVDQSTVFVLRDSILVKHPVEIVTRSEESVLIRGLRANDQVVIAGVNNLYEGQKAEALQ